VEVSPGQDSVDVGDSLRFAATVKSAVGNVLVGMPVTWTTYEDKASIGADGVVTGRGAGYARVYARSGTRVGYAELMVCARPAPGEVVAILDWGPIDFCLGARQGGAEYTLVGGYPVHEGNLAIRATLTATGQVPVSGAPLPIRRAPPPQVRAGSPRLALDARREWAANQRVREQTPRLSPAAVREYARGETLGPGGPRRDITPGVPAVGDRMVLHTGQTCINPPPPRPGRVTAVSAHAVVVADSANPAGGFTTAEYAALAQRFDDVVWPAVAGAFGVPSDLDGNGRVVLFYTRVMNELTPAGAAEVTGGSFFRLDLYPTYQCGGGNAGEILYLAVPDPGGAVNGNAFSKAAISGLTARAQAHHLQHLINASRRLYVTHANFETAWVDEAMSGIAQELAFYAAAGRVPHGNLAAANVLDGGAVESAFYEFMSDNLRNFAQYMRNPEGQSLYGGDPAAYGAGWSFLRYADDRVAGSGLNVWSRLTDGTTPLTFPPRGSYENLAEALQISEHELLGWVGEWQVATYADDIAPGAPIQTVFRVSSWNLRSIYGAPGLDPTVGGGGYPLAVHNPASGVADSVMVVPGGAAYMRFGVPEGGRVAIHAEDGWSPGGLIGPWQTIYVVGRK
jgi:hypothetical protein